MQASPHPRPPLCQGLAASPASLDGSGPHWPGPLHLAGGRAAVWVLVALIWKLVIVALGPQARCLSGVPHSRGAALTAGSRLGVWSVWRKLDGRVPTAGSWGTAAFSGAGAFALGR